MKFLLRSILVLAVAVAFGLMLYYVVQAVPGGSMNQPGVNTQADGSQNLPNTPAPKTERPEKNRGLRWGSILGFARRVIVFSILVFAAVLGKKYIFERKPDHKNTRG
jgi:hypothetical protein